MNTTTTNPSSVHGHEVLFLILESNPPLTRAGLGEQITQRFGPDARFHTCSGSGMTLDHLLTFLLMRGKIVEQNGQLIGDRSRMCAHGDDDHGHG